MALFCEKFFLQIEESTDHYLLASGDDFDLGAKVIASSANPTAQAVLLRINTKDEHDLQNARELIDERASGVFAEMVLLRDSASEGRTREAYLLLNELENALRKLVAIRTASISGDKWWVDRVLKHLPMKAGKYKHEEYRNNEVGDTEITPDGKQDHHDLFYTDLAQLKAVIEELSNWKGGFVGDLKVTKNIERLDLLNRLRRKIAHNRFLSQRNLDDLRHIHGQLMHLCRRIFDQQ